MPSVLQAASPNFRVVLAGVYTILAERKICVVGRFVSAMSFSKTYKHGGESALLGRGGDTSVAKLSESDASSPAIAFGT